MTIQLSPEQEQLIGQAIHAGLIRVPDDVVAAGIDSLREKLAVRQSAPSQMNPDDWERELHEWIHSHSTPTPILPDSALERDSIYRNRGLQTSPQANP
jgi:hypothetical protein